MAIAIDEDENIGRLLHLLQGFCGGDASECAQDEFIMSGTGELLDLKLDSAKNTPAIEDSEASWRFLFLPLASLLVLLVSIGFLHRTSAYANNVLAVCSQAKVQIMKMAQTFAKFMASRAAKESTSEKKEKTKFHENTSAIDQQTRAGDTNEEPMLVQETACMSKNQINAISSSKSSTSPAKRQHLVSEMEKSITISTRELTNTETMPFSNSPKSMMRNENVSLREQKISVHQDGNFSFSSDSSLVQNPLISMKVEASSPLSSFSDDQLKQQGGEIARHMTIIMSEFEATMKENGYEVSQSDSMSIASQRLSSLEAIQLHKASEARQFLYDAHQRNLDRSIAEQRHNDLLDAQEQDKEWFQKLQAARQNCIQAIFPAMQKSCLSIVIGYFVLKIGFPNAFTEKNFIVGWNDLFSGDFYEFRPETPAPITMETPWGTYALAVLLSRAWAIVLIPFVSICFLSVAQLFMPSMILQICKTLLLAWFLIWASGIPWKSICLAQIAFWVMIQLWSHHLFESAQGQLMNRKRACPTCQEVTQHLAVFDKTSRSMTLIACLVNSVVLLWCTFR
mmetsp:Transcript_10204/g.21059  ORF Transcript_10204/g.21059 Transcript_10204/m.21059 type:complete len:566 (-) Transcript_10204:305-2002(-)